MLITLALGGGITEGDSESARGTLHAFIGLPIPIYWIKQGCGHHEEERPAWMPYAEPFFRPRLELGPSARAIYEVGLLLKMRFNLDPRAWRPTPGS
jgi:hypothetical protein